MLSAYGRIDATRASSRVCSNRRSTQQASIPIRRVALCLAVGWVVSVKVVEFAV